MRTYTAEEFAELYDEVRAELVRGVVEVRDSPGTPHGWVATEMVVAIYKYLESHPIGSVMVDVDHVLERGPDTVRRPDVSFMSNARGAGTPPRKMFEFSPDLPIEVVSPSNRLAAITKKLAEYFRTGARMVWIANPKNRTVTVHAPDAVPYVLGMGEILDGGDVLPGFRVPIDKLFREPFSHVAKDAPG